VTGASDGSRVRFGGKLRGTRKMNFGSKLNRSKWTANRGVKGSNSLGAQGFS